MEEEDLKEENGNLREIKDGLQEAGEDLQETKDGLQEAAEDLQETNGSLQEAAEELQETKGSLQEAADHLQAATESQAGVTDDKEKEIEEIEADTENTESRAPEEMKDDAAPAPEASPLPAASPAAENEPESVREAQDEGQSAREGQTAEEDQEGQTAEEEREGESADEGQSTQKDQGEQSDQKNQIVQKDKADQKDQGGKKKKKKKKASAGRIAFRITLLLFLLALGGIYYYGYEYCGTHFMPNTRINIFDCSGLTEEEVQQRFADAAQDYVLNVRFRGGATEMLSAEDMGFAYKPDGSVAALLQQQDQLVWPKYFFEDSTYNIETGGTYDEDKLMAAVTALPELQEANMEKPENAYIHFKSGNDEEDGVFEIVPDTAGSTIDPVQLAAALGDAASRYEEVVDAEEVPGAYQTAEITKDNPDIVSRCKDLNEIVGASITYEMPDGELIKLNSDVMVNWLVEDKKGRLVKDDDVWDEHLWAFLQELANHGNTLGMKRRFRSTLRGEITVSGGDYGYMVNQIVEHDLLMEDLPACKKETRRPSYYLTPYNEETENDGIGKSYIEVDLAAQHVWCYIDGELKMDCDCVSGNTTDGHATPTGVFGIMFMKKDTTLRGVMQKNGEYEYETKVGYWMPFYDGCGFHDAWWRTAFGGNIYKGDGSHGCVNLPVDGAEALFSYCDEKMPVVVYE